MRYFLTTEDGRELEVVVEDRPDGRHRVVLGDREFVADFRDVDGLGQYALLLDRASFAVSVSADDPQAPRVHVAGESFVFRALDERERLAGEVAGRGPARGEEIQAAMPGAVVAVHVAVGDVLEANAPVVVLEAMKMQNEVRCEHGGVVAEVAIAAGDTVESGQLLVRLEPPPEE